MGFKGHWIGFCGAAIKHSSVVGPVLRIRYIAGIEESASVVWTGCQPCVELGLGCLPVRLDDGGFGFCNLRGGRRVRGALWGVFQGTIRSS